jgi:hypothetical protein
MARSHIADALSDFALSDFALSDLALDDLVTSGDIRWVLAACITNSIHIHGRG